MAVIYRTTLRTARMTAVRDAIDAGSGPGMLEIGTTGFGSVLSQHTLSDPCGTVSGDVLTFGAIGTDTAANATGTAAEARIKDSDGNIVVSGLTVGTSAANVIVPTTSIVANAQVSVASGTLTHNTSGV